MWIRRSTVDAMRLKEEALRKLIGSLRQQISELVDTNLKLRETIEGEIQAGETRAAQYRELYEECKALHRTEENLRREARVNEGTIFRLRTELTKYIRPTVTTTGTEGMAQ